MSRNVAVLVFRGLKSAMPVLSAGELGLATDEVQLYVGTASGNKLVLCNTLGMPTGSGGGVSAPKHLTGDPGPMNPMKIVTFAKIVIGGMTFWIPLMQ